MENDIETIEGFNISEVGKYGKFINFTRLPEEYKDRSLYPDKRPFHFFSNEMKKEKLKEDERYLSMIRLQECLDRKIEDELKKEYKLQSKIEEIQRKAKARIEKLREKPLKKLREKYNYKVFEEYFEPKIKPSSSEESPSVS